MNRFIQCPDSVLDYRINWAGWLETGDSIVQSAWEAETGVNITNDGNTTTAAWVFVSGGASGIDYTLTNAVTTDQGRKHCQRIVIEVR